MVLQIEDQDIDSRRDALDRRPGLMRLNDDIGQIEQALGHVGLVVEHVEPGAPQSPAVKSASTSAA